MALRVAAQSAGAEAIAKFLATSPKISRSLYPTLKTHPQHDLAMSQMSGGGTLVAFEVVGGREAAFRLLNALKLITISNNLGDTKSLATHPATTTHMRIGAEERARLGITDGIIRLSVGLEDPQDLIEDLVQALEVT
jgi:O-succinylhomoserine sulfhydrylase